MNQGRTDIGDFKVAFATKNILSIEIYYFLSHYYTFTVQKLHRTYSDGYLRSGDHFQTFLGSNKGGPMVKTRPPAQLQQCSTLIFVQIF